MNDLMKMLSELMSSEPAVSTRTQPSGQSILDLMTPDSVKYGSPTTIIKGKTESTGIPMNVVAIRKALEKIAESDNLSTAIGSEILNKRDEFNQKREGRFVVKTMLDKLATGNAPGGLVAYRTEQGFPRKSRGTITAADFREALNQSSPDTIAVFGNKSSDPRYKEMHVNSILHELIHAGSKKDTKLYRHGKRREHQETFDKAVNKSLKNRTFKDLLYNAMNEKSVDGNFLDMITR